MPDDRTATTQTSSQAPTPRLELTPEKRGFLATGGRLDCLVELSVALPDVDSDRHPLDLALVIDRSGSMSGAPLVAARAAAREAVRMLLPGDRVAVATFDNVVQLPVPLSDAAADGQAIVAAIEGVRAGGSTDLFGGWAEGLSQVLPVVSRERVARVVLLSDGRANHGVTDAQRIAADVAQAAVMGVTTTALGFGAHYDEALLRGMADAGGGNYQFIEDESQTVDAFQVELASASALRGRDVRLAVIGHGVRLTQVGGANAGGGALPALVGGLPFDALVTLEFEPGASVEALSLTWDDVISGRREELRVPLVLEPVSPAGFAALPSDERVVAMRRALVIAQLKREAAVAAERNQVDLAQGLLARIAAEVSALPPGVTRDEEAAELERLTRHAHDMSRLAKRAEYGARTRFMSQAPAKLAALKELELERLELRKRKHLGAGATSAVQAAAAALTLRLTAVDGRQASVQVVTGDITTERVDAIVNSTNRGMFGVAGVDGSLHRKGGKEFTAAVRSLGQLDYGTAVFTPGFELAARYVIHVAAPPFQDAGDAEALARCYREAFELADRLGVTSLALPLIGAGFNGYPASLAEAVQEAEVAAWLTQPGGTCALVRLVGLAQRTRAPAFGAPAGSGAGQLVN